MLDREKVEAILMRRFPGAAPGAIAAAANGIMGLEDEWEELGPAYESRAPEGPRPECRDACVLAQELDPCGEIRIFRRRIA